MIQGLPASAWVFIIRSGIVGASVAYGILDKHAGNSVLTLEARTIPSGDTARNSGCSKQSNTRFRKTTRD